MVKSCWNCCKYRSVYCAQLNGIADIKHCWERTWEEKPLEPDLSLSLEGMASILKAAWENGRVHGREEATEEMVKRFKEMMQ